MNSTRKVNDYTSECYDDLSKVVTSRQASDIIGVPVATILYWCQCGYLVAQQYEGRGTWLISARDVWLKTRSKRPS